MFFTKRLFAFVLLLLVLSSCGEYQKALKNEDVKAKYDLAHSLYEKGEYRKAIRLFEQIVPKYVGKPQGERVMFFFADSYYQVKDYYLAGYHFERFTKSYPKSDKMQEASFMEARSYYELSPKYSLDQTDTDKAIGKLQTFINKFPESEFFSEANRMAQELTNKKEKKQIEIAKQFDRLGEFNYPLLVSSIKALDNFILENPGSEFREEAFYYRLKSATHLARNSTVIKKKERIDEAQKAYNALLKSYPETQYKTEAEDHLKAINSELEIYKDYQELLGK